MSTTQPGAPGEGGQGRTAAPGPPWDRLSRHLGGDLVLPSNTAYAVARQLELAQFDEISPQAVVFCADSADVSLAIRFAQDHRLPVAVRSGGHSYGGYSTSSGLVLDLSRLNRIAVGPQAVTLGPGALNVDILDALTPHGLVVSEGGCPTVACGGFIQGGGYGLLTRALGMACDALTSAEVVLADGRTVTASAQEDSDLFWAIRGGGGGNFGVVTSFAVTPYPLDLMHTANLFFPYERTAQVLDGFTQWLEHAPRTLGGGAYVVLPDAQPGAVPVMMVLLASVGTPGELDAQARRLESFTGAAVNRQGGSLTYQALMMNVFQCSQLTPAQAHRRGKSAEGVLPRPAFGVERTRLCSRHLGQGGWEQVMAAFDAEPAAGQLRQLEVHMFGGAVNDVDRTGTAMVHRDSLFSVNYRSVIADAALDTPDSRATARRWADRGFAAVDPYSNGETFQNWMDPALTDWRQSYYAENYPRLEQIKGVYDPHRFFSFAQGVGAPR